MDSSVGIENFCSRCGKSHLPLNVPHLAAGCVECGKTIHFVRYAKDGAGLSAKAGEQFVMPPITLSLDPTGRGRLFRPGLQMLLKLFFLGQRPEQPSVMELFAGTLNEQADQILKSSKLLAGLDLDNESDAKAAVEIVKKNDDTREWHALSMGAWSQSVRDAMASGDTARAAWCGYMLGTSRGLTIVTEPVFEQTLWRGYLANQVVYEAAAAASMSPGEAEAIKKLEPLFQQLDEPTLHTWVESKLPIGPRIGIKELPEEVLLALAKWHLAGFQRSRDRKREEAADRRASSDLRLKWVTRGVTTGIAISGAVYAGLKVIGVL